MESNEQCRVRGKADLDVLGMIVTLRVPERHCALTTTEYIYTLVEVRSSTPALTYKMGAQTLIAWI